MNEKKAGRPVITYQTGPEESFLIGTKQQLVEFAQSIIKAVESAEPDDFFGFPSRVCPLDQGILDGKGVISIDHVVVVERDEIKDDIFYCVSNS